MKRILFLIFGIALSVVGLYFYHQQYLCYEYTPLLFILGVVVSMGCALLSVPIHIKDEGNKKKIALKSVVAALVTA